MSTTNVRRLGNVRAAVNYVEIGTPTEFSELFREGKRTRAAASHLDAQTSAEFVKFCEQTAAKKNRRVEAISIIQSFRKEDMDQTKPEDVQKANDLGYELAREMFPDSSRYVVTHTDSKGGYVHNHILIANHDFKTGRAVSAKAKHVFVARANDGLMKQHGIERVVPHWEKTKAAREAGRDDLAVEIAEASSVGYWDKRRAGKDLIPFHDALHEQISAAMLDDESVDMESFEKALGKRGVKLERKTHTRPAKRGKKPTESVGIIYKMHDETRGRMGQRKASLLDEMFMQKNLEAFFENKKREKEQQHATHTHETEAQRDFDLVSELERQRAELDEFQTRSGDRIAAADAGRDGAEAASRSAARSTEGGDEHAADARLHSRADDGSARAERQGDQQDRKPNEATGSLRDAGSGRDTGSTEQRKQSQRRASEATRKTERETGQPRKAGKGTETIQQHINRLNRQRGLGSDRDKDRGYGLGD